MTAEAAESAEYYSFSFRFHAPGFDPLWRDRLGEFLDMLPPGEEEDLTTKQIIGKAIAIHRALGPGLLESVYEYFLARELRKAGFVVEQQKPIPVHYEGEPVDLGFRPDLIINGEVIVEIKTVKKLAPIHDAQLLSYLKLADIERGLLINFHELKLVDGIKRLSLTRDYALVLSAAAQLRRSAVPPFPPL